jgi:hypothetical protein
MPTEISISFWVNPVNQGSVKFVDELKLDLEKCLSRFKLSATFKNAEEADKSSYTVVTLSESDFNEPETAKQIRSFLSKSNAIAIFIDPIDLHSLKESGSIKPIYFWEKSYETSEILLVRKSTPDMQARYWEKVTDIVQLIEEGQKTATKATQKPKVYISQVYNALQPEWENLMRSIVDLGYDVVPSSLLSNNIDECKQQITELASSAELIVLLIPPMYNPFFTTQHLSLAEHQCNITAQLIQTNATKAKRLIWIPSMYEAVDEENQVFVERIQRDDFHSQRTRVLKSPIEDLKRVCQQALSGQMDIISNDEPDTYLIFDSLNPTVRENIISKAQQQGISIKSNVDGITYRQHIETLAKSKVAAICYTSANETWLRVKTAEILKSKGMDSYKPFQKVVLLKTADGNGPSDSTFTNIVENVDEFITLLKPELQ